MTDFLTRFLLTSGIVSVTALGYMVLSRHVADKFSARTLYLGWVLIALAFIIPFRIPSAPTIADISISAETVVIPRNAENAPVSSQKPVSQGRDIRLHDVILYIWIIGMFIQIMQYIIRHSRFIHFTRRWSQDVTDDGLLYVMEFEKQCLGVKQDIKLRSCQGITSPMLTGLASPVILLPDRPYTNTQITFILKHELVHYDRKDLWTKLLIVTAGIIHWFNPVLYLVRKASAVQCELACDEQVLLHQDSETRYSYTEVLLDVTRVRSVHDTVLSTGFNGGKKSMKQRIRNIMNTGRKKAGAIVIGCIISTLLISGTVFGVQQAAGGDTEWLLNNLSMTTQSGSTEVADEGEAEADLTALLGKNYKNMTVAEYEAALEKAYGIEPLEDIVQEDGSVLTFDGNTEPDIGYIRGFSMLNNSIHAAVAYSYEITDKTKITVQEEEDAIDHYLQMFQQIAEKKGKKALSSETAYKQLEQEFLDYVNEKPHAYIRFMELCIEEYIVDEKVFYARPAAEQVSLAEQAEQLGYQYCRVDKKQSEVSDRDIADLYDEHGFSVTEGVVFEFRGGDYLIMYPEDTSLIHFSSSCGSERYYAKVSLKTDVLDEFTTAEIDAKGKNIDQTIFNIMYGLTTTSPHKLKTELIKGISEKTGIAEKYIVVDADII